LEKKKKFTGERDRDERKKKDASRLNGSRGTIAVGLEGPFAIIGGKKGKNGPRKSSLTKRGVKKKTPD